MARIQENQSKIKKDPKKGLDYKRVWEQKPKNTMYKENKSIFVRQPPKPFYSDLAEDYDDDLVKQMGKKKFIKLYDVKDIQKELEEVTEDEEELLNQNPHQYEVFKIKSYIKSHLKRFNEHAPKTSLNFYKIGKVLGKGAYGKVNLAVQKLSGKLCAVKSINILKVKGINALKKVSNEKNLLQQLRHDSIVKLYETIEQEDIHYQLIFMEICTGGNLLTYLRKRRRLEERIAKLLMLQLIRGLGYIHDKGIAHRDIKLENILLTNLGHLKICDFGVSHLQQPKKGDDDQGEVQYMPIKDCCGTPAYMAPEVIRLGDAKKQIAKGQDSLPEEQKVKIVGYHRDCDVWSAGVLLYALIYGQLPFRGANVREIKNKVKKGRVLHKNLTNQENPSREVIDLINNMLKVDPADRIKISDIIAHEWFADTPKQEDVTIFDAQERTQMIKDYFIYERPEKWKHLINFQKYEIQDIGVDNFKVENLETVDTEDKLEVKNASERSDILAPQNSSLEEGKSFYEEDLPNEFAVTTKWMSFSHVAQRAELMYLREHNIDVDNGVYKQGANVQKIAHMAGLKTDLEVEKTKAFQANFELFNREMTPEEDRKTMKMKQNQAPPDWDTIDPKKNWDLCMVPDPLENPYHDMFTIRSDHIFNVTRFGYKKEHIYNSLWHNVADHAATTYYLLAVNHEDIC